ncbi:type II secretion system protein GspL [Croceicoccus bisphenolivorans]|uniref:type II secretion system protein GspL n=1 Tax=Croceicoccus bisphenolivorans TaxID=1783232 RepID=UPI0008331E4A|nr:type II secretion system protein GspL [Croceicoccus bisphenolivorans]
MALRLNHDRPEAEEVAPVTGASGLVVVLPEHPQGEWRWWRVEDGALGTPHRFTSGHDAPWGDVDDRRVVALAPAALAPVRQMLRGDMPMAQALAAARLDPPGLRTPLADTHVAVAGATDGGSVLSATVAKSDMDTWLAELAANGLDADAVLPAALLLPQPASGQVATGVIAGQALARTPNAAFAGEAELLPVLAPGAEAVAVADDELGRRLLAQFDAPELDLRQGVYARPRVSYFRLPDWQQLARMALLLLLLVFAYFVVETVKLNLDAAAQEDAAIEAAQAKFPGVGDLATAETQIRSELMRRGAGGVAFADSAPAVFAAMQPNPSIRLRNLNWQADGTLAIRAAAPTSDALNQMLIALQRDGWVITVPPQIAPDATGATVADITVRAP